MDGGGGAEAAPRVLLGCALGRLSVDGATGELNADAHCLLADDFNSDSSIPFDAKKARSHLRAILRKGGSKLTPGKRLRLHDDDDGYDVHILCDRIDSASPPCTLIFFALTVPNFNKVTPTPHHTHAPHARIHRHEQVTDVVSAAPTLCWCPVQYYSIAAVLRELKGAVYGAADVAFLSTSKASHGSANRSALLPAFARVTSHYGHSPLATAETKVAEVRSIMSASVARALSSVEQLEELEESSERFEEQSKQFSKRSTSVKKVQKRNYVVLGLLCTAIVLAVALYFIIPAAVSSSSSPSSTFTSSSSSSSTAGPG